MKQSNSLKVKSISRSKAGILILLSVFLLTTFSPSTSQAQKREKIQLSNLSREAIEKMKMEQNLDNLSTGEYRVFEHAVFNFEQMGEKAVTPLLIHLKKNDDDKKARTAVIYALGRIGKNAERALPNIISYLKHDDYDTRLSAISALGRMGKTADKAVLNLKRFLYNSDSESEKLMAMRSLKDIGTPQAESILAELKKYELLKKQREKISQENKG